MRSYLSSLYGMCQRNLIVPSLDRNLTDDGRRVVNDTLGDILSTTSFRVERLVGLVGRIRQVQPDLSEVDAFVYEAADVAYHCSTDEQRKEVNARECSMSIPRNWAYFLAGIRVLREATEAGMITINPPGSPKDQCYVRYN